MFKSYDPAQNYSFAGSNVLETQIKNGAPADIFASAAPLNTQRLYAAGSSTSRSRSRPTGSR